MKITDKKALGKEFKYFKTHYVSLNFGYPNIYMRPNSNNIYMLFYPNNQFSIITGKITSIETEFLQWCIKHDTIAHIADFIKIGKCLQKNIIEIEYDDDRFCFKFINKDNVEEHIEFVAHPNIEEVIPLISKVDLAEKELSASTNFKLTDEYFDGELFEAYINTNDNGISPTKQHSKIIEIEKKEIKAFLKNMTSSKIRYSSLNSSFHRYVCISSEDSELDLQLSQYFITL